MLSLTPAATDVIRDLVETSHLPETAGLRVQVSDPSMNGSQGGLAVSLVEEPEPEDEVLDEDGVHIFLSPQAASLVSKKKLDAVVDQGNVTFLLHEQA